MHFVEICGRRMGRKIEHIPPETTVRLRNHELQPATLVRLASRRHLKCTKTEASAKLLPTHPSALLDWKSLSNQSEHFIFPSERLKGHKPLDLASVLKKKVQPAFKKIGITGVGWHTFRHTVGTMLEEDGRTSAHNPRLLAAQQPSCREQVNECNRDLSPLDEMAFWLAASDACCKSNIDML